MELVCSCGQVVRCDAPPAGGQTRCPACGAVVSAGANLPPGAPSADPTAAGARKPLWALMRDAPPPAVVSAGEQPPTSTPVRKGLWGMMQSTPPIPAPPPPPAKSEIRQTTSDIESPTSEIPNPKSQI